MCSSFNIYIEFLQLDIGESFPFHMDILNLYHPTKGSKKFYNFRRKFSFFNLFIELLHGEKIHKKYIVILKSNEEKKVT